MFTTIFEATPYRPGPDGGFHPHEEATGFAAHGAATLKDTAGRALLNVEAALARGLRVFDGAVGGLGGCPFAAHKGEVTEGSKAA